MSQLGKHQLTHKDTKLFVRLFQFLQWWLGVDDITLFLIVIMMGLSGLLCFVSLASWYRLKLVKFGLVSFAFLIFFLKSLLLVFEIIIQDEKAVIVDTLVLVLFYFSVVKR